MKSTLLLASALFALPLAARAADAPKPPAFAPYSIDAAEHAKIINYLSQNCRGTEMCNFVAPLVTELNNLEGAAQKKVADEATAKLKVEAAAKAKGKKK